MKTKPNSSRSLAAKLLLGLLITAGALLASNCAYQETMNQRNAEGEYLQQQLQSEHARGQSLSR